MKLYNQNYIWDLHIHTCKCKKPSKEFKNMSIEEYIDGLLNIYSSYKNLKLISFTDHNRISYDVINEFEKRGTGISVIPGVEVDLYLKKEDVEKRNFKHLVFYFDPVLLKYQNFLDEINEYLVSNQSIMFNDFLDMLIEKKFEFLISPHFLKQEKRGIDTGWVNHDITTRKSKKYIDQFFCFWESAGASSIALAQEFVNEYCNEERVSIVSFSDGNTFEKINDYLSNPPQYFAALPTFSGLKIVGSDSRRIDKNLQILEEERKNNYLGRIIFEGNEIHLSSKLNVIVGGRGSGKSILADKIAIELSNEKRKIIKEKNNKRLDFLDSKPIEIYNMSNRMLRKDSILYDYYNQGYITDLFSSKDIDMKEIYFSGEFNQLKKFNEQKLRSEIVTKYTELVNDFKPVSLKDNLTSLESKIKNVDYIKKPVKLSSKVDKYKKLSYAKYKKIYNKVFVNTIIPKEIQDNPRILKSFADFFTNLNQEIYNHNLFEIDVNYLNNSIRDIYDKEISARDKQHKIKSATLKLIKDSINNEVILTKERVDIIKSLIEMSKEIPLYDFDNKIVQGYEGNRFEFLREVSVEHPLKYFFRLFDKYFDSQITGIKSNQFPLKIKDAIDIFCYDPLKNIKKSKKLSNMINELTSFETLLININNSIKYNDGNKIISLDEQSPGTKANILMEYIAYVDTNVPLIIDQPEDNVDNFTIYNKLTNWFEAMKERRQILVVTHDANIVVNADSENIIFTTNIDDHFNYTYGAFEYDNNIENISNVLEGGKNAIERRLKKYGK